MKYIDMPGGKERLELPATKEEYTDFFSKLPDEWERAFEVGVTGCANHFTPEDIEILNDIIEDYNRERDADQTREDKVSYAAFYTLNRIYRTSFDDKKLTQLTEENRAWCTKHPTFVHLRALRILQMGEYDRDEISEIIREEYALAKQYPDNAGYLHAVGDLYASACEKDETFANELKRDGLEEKAEKAVDKAIKLDPNYAKYYCTMGRILALKGDFDKADEMMRQAISFEDSGRTDYAMRINAYQISRLQIQSKRLIAETKEQIGADKIREEMGELKHAVVSNVEILAFFSGLITFVIGALNLAKDQTAAHASMLIITLMGCLVAVFSVFGAILHLGDESYKNKIRWNWIIAGAGLLVALGSTVFAAIL